MRSWLIASHLIPLFVIIPVVGFTIYSLLNSQFVIDRLSADLANQAELIAEVANTQPGVWQDQSVDNRDLLAISRDRHWDVIILDAQGNLLATNNPNYLAEVGGYVADVPQMDNLQSGRPAIFYGISERTQTQVADVAVPATNADNQVVGIVRVTTELDTLTQDFAELQRIVLLVVAFALLVGLGLSLLLALAIERPLRNLTFALQGVGQADISPDLPTLRIDEVRLAQAVGNLLSNAIKYTPAGGSIGLDTGSDASELWIRIRDTGSGITSSDRNRIFEAFYRGQQNQRFPQGLGLGLTIARELIEAHGGRLNLDSREGVGSAFTIRLPM